MIITKVFKFEASHQLDNYDGVCSKLHGHSYKLHVSVSGEVINGFVMDFKDLKKVVDDEILSKLDHSHLNDFIEFPSAENIIKWIWDRLKDKLNLSKIILYETEDSYIELSELY